MTTTPQLFINGKLCRGLKSVHGGGMYTKIVSGATHSGRFLGNLISEEIMLEISPFRDKETLDEWICSSWKTEARRDCSIMVTDLSNSNVLSSMEFSNVVMAQTIIPTLDVSSEAPGLFTLKLQPESTRFGKKPPRATTPAQPQKPAVPADPLWKVRDFRLEIKDIDASKVTRVESFTILRPITHPDVVSGSSALPRMAVGRLQFPNLRISMPLGDVQPFISWFDESLVRGMYKGKDAKLFFLKPDRKEFAHIDLFNLGICRTSFGQTTVNGETPQVQFELYYERMEYAVP